MLGIDENQDLTSLMSKEVLQICIGRYEYQLHLTEDTTISIEAMCRLVYENGKVLDIRPDDLIARAQLVLLIGEKVIDVETIGGNSI